MESVWLSLCARLGLLFCEIEDFVTLSDTVSIKSTKGKSRNNLNLFWLQFISIKKFDKLFVNILTIPRIDNLHKPLHDRPPKVELSLTHISIVH